MLQWLEHLEAMEESGWFCKCRTFKFGGGLSRENPRKTWTEVIRSYLRERKVMKVLNKGK